MNQPAPGKPRKTFANVHMLGQRKGFLIDILSEPGCFQLIPEGSEEPVAGPSGPRIFSLAEAWDYLEPLPDAPPKPPKTFDLDADWGIPGSSAVTRYDRVKRKEAICKGVSRVLEPHGFRRQKTSWTRTNGEVGALFHVRAGKYGRELVPTIGFWFVDQLDKVRVEEDDTSIIMWPIHFLPEERKRPMEHAFRTDNPVDDVGARDRLIEEVALPIFDEIVDAKSMFDFCRRRHDFGVRRQALDRFIEHGFMREYGGLREGILPKRTTS